MSPNSYHRRDLSGFKETNQDENNNEDEANSEASLDSICREIYKQVKDGKDI